MAEPLLLSGLRQWQRNIHHANTFQPLSVPILQCIQLDQRPRLVRLQSTTMSRRLHFSVAAVAFVVVSFATLLSPTVEAHGYIAKPAATYIDIATKTWYNTRIDETINLAFVGHKWNDAPVNNTKTFTQRFRAGGFASLRALLDPVVPDCGNSRIDVPPVDVTGLTTMQFQNDEYKEGFIDTHDGPCEIWIDDTRVFQGDNCAPQYRTYPAYVPVDYSSCAPGKTCILRFYWLPVHEPLWQLYKQCVPIKRGA